MSGIKFEKVSYEQFLEDVKDAVNDEIEEDDVRSVWEAIDLPTRSTAGSSGYDIRCPYTEFLKPGKSVVIPTGIRVKMPEGVCLLIMPRSGVGFKYGLVLDNTIGNIDSDYYNADNEGHIKVKIHTTTTDDILCIRAGDRFVQGVFTPYYVTDDDDATDTRSGGFGSTGE